jgi:archaeal flagellin FlaB
MWNKFVKDEKGFTGLEAAIVLVAFVVVAAVFSYVMLGAGFYTTQKSQEVVHTGVTQASSSVELSGDVVGKSAVGTEIEDLVICLQLTSGGSSVDMAKTLIVVSAPDITPTELTYLAGTADSSHFDITTKYNADADDIIDKSEKFDVAIDLESVSGAEPVLANDEFQVEIKPPQGASYTIHRRAPPSISAVMVLV